MRERTPPSTGGLLLAMIGFLAIGGPTVFFLWEEMSTLLYGHVRDVRGGVLLGSIAVFVVLLGVLARWARGLARPGFREESA